MHVISNGGRTLTSSKLGTAEIVVRSDYSVIEATPRNGGSPNAHFVIETFDALDDQARFRLVPPRTRGATAVEWAGDVFYLATDHAATAKENLRHMIAPATHPIGRIAVAFQAGYHGLAAAGRKLGL